MSVVAPHEDLAHGESRDPFLSFTFEARIDAARREVDTHPGVILWCMNADDPRCSPVDGSSDASLSATALRLESPDVPTVAAPAANAVVFAPYEPCRATGTRSRVDRPPRA
jgi:hypothetical protein